MRTKHTPGPWLVFISDILDTVEVGQTPKGALGPCAVATLHRTVANFTTVDRRKANAALIAAAPEMLEALIDVDELLNGFENLTPTHARIKAAIRKALGEEENS